MRASSRLSILVLEFGKWERSQYTITCTVQAVLSVLWVEIGSVEFLFMELVCDELIPTLTSLV